MTENPRLPRTGNAAADTLTLEELVGLARSGQPVDDRALAGLEARAGGRDAFAALVFDAALESLKQTTRALQNQLTVSRDFNRSFTSGMAQLDASQRRTRALIEDLVNG